MTVQEQIKLTISCRVYLVVDRQRQQPTYCIRELATWFTSNATYGSPIGGEQEVV